MLWGWKLTRVEQIVIKEMFFTLKNYKVGFYSKFSFRSLNSSKIDLEKLSKIIVQNTSDILQIDQLENITDWIKWFQNIENPQNCSFLKYFLSSQWSPQYYYPFCQRSYGIIRSVLSCTVINQFIFW